MKAMFAVKTVDVQRRMLSVKLRATSYERPCDLLTEPAPIMEIELPDTKRNREAFRVGRFVAVEVSPR